MLTPFCQLYNNDSFNITFVDVSFELKMLLSLQFFWMCDKRHLVVEMATWGVSMFISTGLPCQTLVFFYKLYFLCYLFLSQLFHHGKAQVGYIYFQLCLARAHVLSVEVTIKAHIPASEKCRNIMQHNVWSAEHWFTCSNIDWSLFYKLYFLCYLLLSQLVP